MLESLGSALTYTIDGGRGGASEWNVAGASDAHKKVKIDLIGDRLDWIT